MADQEMPSNPNPSIPSLCDECGLNPWKHRCPRSHKYYCMHCVRSPVTRTKSPAQSSEDKVLVFGNNLLEKKKGARTEKKTTRAEESACRMAGSDRLGTPEDKMMLYAAAKRRGTTLAFDPESSWRKKNQTRYDHRKNSIYWTIEWRFLPKNIVLVDHGVDEHDNLFSVITKHFATSPLKNQLSQNRSVQIDDLVLFIRKNPQRFMSPLRKLDIKAPIGSELADVVVVEYPVVLVFCPKPSYKSEVEKDVGLSSKKVEAPGSFDSKLIPKGNLSMEEKIVHIYTLVQYLMDHANSEATSSIQQDYSVADNPVTVHVSDMQISEEFVNGLKPNSNQKHQASTVQEAKRNYIRFPILKDCDMQVSRTVADSSARDLTGHMNSVPSTSIQQDYAVVDKAVHVSDVQISREDVYALKPNSSQKHRASTMQEAKRNYVHLPILKDCDLQISLTVSDSSVRDVMGHMNSVPSASIQQDCPAADRAVHVSDMQISREIHCLKPNSSQKHQASTMQEAKRNVHLSRLKDCDLQISLAVSDSSVRDVMGHMNSVPSASIQQDYPAADRAAHVSDMQISREAFHCLKPNSSQKHQASEMQEAKRNYIQFPILKDYDM